MFDDVRCEPVKTLISERYGGDVYKLFPDLLHSFEVFAECESAKRGSFEIDARQDVVEVFRAGQAALHPISGRHTTIALVEATELGGALADMYPYMREYEIVPLSVFMRHQAANWKPLVLALGLKDNKDAKNHNELVSLDYW